MKPFFSVIIPTLNEEKFLPKLLKDLTNQTEKDFEVIIVDSFSKDKTKDCIKIFKNLLKIRFIQIIGKNVAIQRNRGVINSNGRFLVFLDADTRIKSRFLKKSKNFINNNPGLLFLPYFTSDRGDKQYQPLFDLVNILVELSQNLPKRFSLGGSMIVEHNFFNSLGGFDDKLYIAEDHELVQRAGQWGIKSKFIKDAGISFSLRRMKKEGQLRFFYQYFIVSARRLLFNEEIKSHIFEYQMGGQLYNIGEHKQKKEEFLDKYINQLRQLAKKILTT